MQSFDGKKNEQDMFLIKFRGYLNDIDGSASDIGDDFAREQVVQRLRMVLLIIENLLSEFRATPNAPLEEIGKRIELSRNALYVTFASCGIDEPEELRHPSVHLARFLKDNRVHGALVRLVMEVQGNYLLLRDALDSATHDELFVDWEVAYECKGKDKGVR